MLLRVSTSQRNKSQIQERILKMSSERNQIQTYRDRQTDVCTHCIQCVQEKANLIYGDKFRIFRVRLSLGLEESAERQKQWCAGKCLTFKIWIHAHVCKFIYYFSDTKSVATFTHYEIYNDLYCHFYGANQTLLLMFLNSCTSW